MPDTKQVTLITERLKLRWMDEFDIPAHYLVFSDPEVTRYWSRGPWTDVAEAAEALAATMTAYADGSALRLGMELRDSGELIGSVSLHHFEDASRRCELGYALGRAHWGHGYVTEALRALLDYGFHVLGLNRIEADIDPRNIASARVLEKLGFRKEGYMSERWIVQGEPADTVWYGLLRRHWDTLSGPSDANQQSPLL
jgi:ribosomal-protein-alanine N-acetyltransferase